MKSTINLIKLSDAFRRRADMRNDKTATALVKEARKIAALSTWYYPEYPTGGMNNEVDRKMKKEITRLAEIAARLKVDEVILPLRGDRRSWIARRVEENVLQDLDLPVKVSLQKEEYDRDLSALGPINRRVKTALDVGLRGVMDISDIKYKWDRRP